MKLEMNKGYNLKGYVTIPKCKMRVTWARQSETRGVAKGVQVISGQKTSAGAVRRLVTWVAAGAVVGAVLSWAVIQVFAPPAAVRVTEQFTTATVADGTVAFSLTLNTSAVWKATVTGRNLAGGTVTTIPFDASKEATNGEVLYTVDMRPVVIGVGQIPAYRNLTEGDTGPDVAQLQGVLAAGGWYSGAQDGDFGAATTRAAKAWQKSLGVAVDGVVRASDVIYAPELPAKLVIDSKVVFRGAALGGGETVVSAVGATPDFSIAVTDQQARTIPLGTQVSINAPNGGSWSSKVVDTTTDSNKQIWLVLGSTTDQAICADQCAQVPASGENLLSSRVVVTPETSGLVVPTAALKTTADGTIVVLEPNGTAHSVSVTASARGMSVITGVDAGLVVRVPAQDS